MTTALLTRLHNRILALHPAKPSFGPRAVRLLTTYSAMTANVENFEASELVLHLPLNERMDYASLFFTPERIGQIRDLERRIELAGERVSAAQRERARLVAEWDALGGNPLDLER